MLGARFLVGKLPLRYFSHLLIVVLAVGIVGFGGLGRVGSSNVLSLQHTMREPSAFARPHGTPERDLLVRNPDSVTLLVNRPRQGITKHIVAEGETVYSIADNYSVSAQTVLWANDMEEDSVLNTGQVLTILPVSGILHMVQDGETIEEIAWKYKSDVRAIVDFNQLTNPSWLAANDVLVVPGGRREDKARAVLASRSTQRPSEDAASEVKSQALKPSTYEVKPGDNLGTIADRFGVSQDTLIAANNLGDNPDMLSPGQTLTILPVSGVLYTVQDGDSLGSIANRYDVESERITSANGMVSADLLTVGQKLVIPGAKPVWQPQAPPEPSLVHVVRPGESVRYIAEIYNVNPAKITRSNGLYDADVVQIGQKLVIPGGQAPAVASVARTASVASSRGEPTASQPAPAPKPAAAPPPPAAGEGWRIVEVASKYLGYRYVWGGTSPAGFDCSGLVWYVYKTAGKYVPRDLWGQLQAGPRIRQDNLQPGDIVFFENTYQRGLSHDGIYIGGGRFIHAASEAEGVRISSLGETYWAARYYGATRAW